MSLFDRKNSSFSFRKNFPDVIEKPCLRIIHYEMLTWLIGLILSTTYGITIGGTVYGISGYLIVAIAAIAVSIGTLSGQDKARTKATASSIVDGGTLANRRSVTEAISVGYGTCRIGGNIVFFHTRGPENYRLSVVLCYGHGPVEGPVVDSDGDVIWFDEKRISYFEAFKGLDLVNDVFHYGTLKYADYATKIRIQASEGATTIEVDSTSRIFVDEDIGIVLDDDTVHWTTVYSITDADTLVITSGIPSGRNAPVGARVYTIQIADPSIVNEKSDWADAMRGIAYHWFLLKYNVDAYIQMPLITCEMRLRRIKDTRTGEIAWTNNRALAMYDFMTNPIYGRGLPESLPESLLDQDSVNDAANWCEANGYTFDGLVADDKPFADNLLDIMGQRLRYIWSEGKYKFVVLKEDPAVMTLNEDDIVEGSFQIHVPGIPETPTRIKAWFLDKTDRYTRKSFFVDQVENTIFPIVENDDRTPEIILNGTTDYKKAIALAKYELMRRRHNMTFSLLAKARAVALEGGDMIYLTYSPAGWTNKKLRVLKADIPQSGQIPLLLQDEDPSIYDPAVDVTVYESYESTLPGGVYNPDEPQNLSAETGPDENTDNKYDAYIRFQWDYFGPGYNYVLAWRKADATTWETKDIACPYGVIEVPEKTASGTLNLKSTGGFYGGADADYKIEIDGDSSPNTFKWSNNGGSTWQETQVPVTGAWQELENGAKVKFNATTGGVIGDYWLFTAHTPNPVHTRVAGFACNKEIYWRVKSIDPDGNKSEFATADEPITTWGPEAPPDVVIDDLASVFDGPYPVVKWDGLVPQPEHYELRAEDANWGGPTGYSAIDKVISGTTDMLVKGDFGASSSKNYKVQIDDSSSPNKFRWSDTGGSSWNAENVAITGLWQSLNYGVKVKFSATTGAVYGDYWTFTVYPNSKLIALLAGAKTIFEWTEYFNWLRSNFVTKEISGTLKISLRGDFEGESELDYKIEIDGSGSPNTFKWSNNGGSTWQETAVSITGAWQELENGIQVKFSATTGGVIGDNWIFTCYPNTIAGLARSITVYIKARNKIGTCSALADSIALTNDAPSMYGYSPVATIYEKSKVKLSWATWDGIPEKDIAGYDVYGSTQNPTPIEDAYKIASVGANTHYILLGLLKGITYDLRVRPKDILGNGIASD
jgi:hypothetical protein